jgi:GT2 family glycosyltransferase
MNLVSVIILNWNGQNFLEECLISVKKQKIKNFQIIFVDNASEDNSLNLAKKICPDAIFIPLKKNYGFAIGNNIGFEIVDTPYTALLNNDTVVDRYWLESLIKGLEKNPNAGFAASKMLLYDQPDTIDRAGDAYCRSGTALLRGRCKSSVEFDKPEWVFGACAGAALYRTSMLKKIGFFDNDFFLLYEDVDLSFRAQLQGFQCLYVPHAVVYHHGSKSIGVDSPTSIYYSHRNLEWVYIQNMPSGLLLKSILLHLLYDLASFLFFSYRGYCREYIEAKIAALKGVKVALRKRRELQPRKVVSDDYLWRLMEKERFIPRLTRRLKQ